MKQSKLFDDSNLVRKKPEPPPVDEMFLRLMAMLERRKEESGFSLFWWEILPNEMYSRYVDDAARLIGFPPEEMDQDGYCPIWQELERYWRQRCEIGVE